MSEENNKGGIDMKIKPTNDLLFKKIMTSKGTEFVLEDFIEVVTGMKLTNVRPTNPFQIDSYEKTVENVDPTMYSTIVDVAATTEEGIDIIIEMQLYKQQKFFERILNYLSTAYVQNYKAKETKPIISIVVADFAVFSEFQEAKVEIGLTNLAYHQEILNQEKQPYLRVYLVNLTEKAILEEKSTDFTKWRKFLKTGKMDEDASEGLKEAYRIATLSNLSGKERRLAEKMEKYEDAYYQTMKYQREKGMKEGVALGEKRGIALGEKRGIALGERRGQVMICFKMNLPTDEIQKHTGLTIEEIEAFRKEME